MIKAAYIKALKSAILLFLLLAPYSLFIVNTNFLFPFITAKAYVFCILIEIAFACWLLLCFVEPKYKPTKQPYLIFWLVLLCITLLSNYFGINFSRSFWSTPERMQGFYLLLHLFLFSVVLVSFFKSYKTWKLYLHNLIFVLLGLVIIALIEQFGIDSLSSTLGNALYFAGVCSIGFFLCLFFLISPSNDNNYPYTFKAIYSLLSILFLVGILYSNSRGAFVGCLAGLSVYAVTLLSRCANTRQGKILTSITILFLCCLIVFSFIYKEQIGQSWLGKNVHTIKRLSDISLQDKTTKHRLANWSIALKGIKERPILGWGQENYNVVFEKYYLPERLFDAEDYFDRAHNVYLDKLVFSGIAGLLAYLLIFFFVIHNIIKNPLYNQWQKAALLALLSTYLVQNIFVFDSLATSIYIYIILPFILFKPKVQNISQQAVHHTFIFSAFTVLLLTAFLHQLNVKPIQANRNFILSLKYYSYNKHINNCQQALNKYSDQKSDFLNYCRIMKKYNFDNKKVLLPAFDLMDKILSIRTNINYTTAEYLLNLANIQHLLPEASRIKYQQLVKTAKQRLQTNFKHDAKLNMLYGYYLFTQGNNQQANEYFLTSLSLAPKKFSNINKIAETRILNGEIEKAWRILLAAKKLGPHPKTDELYKKVNNLRQH